MASCCPHTVRVAVGFRGPPTILVDDVDPFAGPDDPIGRAYRIYQRAVGAGPSPTIEQLRAVLVG